ncbi:MAG: PAS domain S-box protein, partial [Patescibacteria group bacterium]|nr:PAS domain S-box protein [Patescibacteria group bacterium]
MFLDRIDEDHAAGRRRRKTSSLGVHWDEHREEGTLRGAVVKIDYCITRWGIRTRPWLAAAGLLLVAGGWMAAWSATPSGPLPMVALLTTLFGMILLASASWVTNRRRANVAAPSPAAVIPSVGRILGQVLTNTDASIILCNRKGRVLWVNNGFTRLTGYTLDDVRGKHSTALLIGPDTDLSTLAEVEERLGRCMPYSGEILNYAKDGRPYQVSFEALPICNGRGRLKSVVAIGRDVTDRVHAEKSLREEQDRYRAIFEAATNSLVIYNREGEVIEANPAACQMYGYSREQLIGLSGRTIVHCDYHHLFAEFLRKVAAGKPFHAVSRDVRQDGTEVDVEVRGAGLVFQGEPAMLAVLTDITEQQRAQRELREYAEAMQAANHSLEEYSFAAQAASRAKSEFLANMSHEIRTPMTAILGFAEMLRNDGDLSKAPPSRIEAIDTVLRNGEHLLRLINDILDLSKIEAGRFGVDRSECSLLSLVSDVQDMVEIRARAKNLPFIVEFAGAIPETIQSDATRLRQILVNLIGNAVKFTDSGEVRLRIEHLDLPSRSLL